MGSSVVGCRRRSLPTACRHCRKAAAGPLLRLPSAHLKHSFTPPRPVCRGRLSAVAGRALSSLLAVTRVRSMRMNSMRSAFGSGSRMRSCALCIAGNTPASSAWPASVRLSRRTRRSSGELSRCSRPRASRRSMTPAVSRCPAPPSAPACAGRCRTGWPSPGAPRTAPVSRLRLRFPAGRWRQQSGADDECDGPAYHRGPRSGCLRRRPVLFA